MTIGEIDLTQNVLELRDRVTILDTRYDHVSRALDDISEQLRESRQDRKDLVSKVDSIHSDLGPRVQKIENVLGERQRIRARDLFAVGTLAAVISAVVGVVSQL